MYTLTRPDTSQEIPGRSPFLCPLLTHTRCLGPAPGYAGALLQGLPQRLRDPYPKRQRRNWAARRELDKTYKELSLPCELTSLFWPKYF